MATTTFANVPENPEIPLKPDVRAAYQELYDQYEGAIENTLDPTLHQMLMTSQQAVADVINADNEAILQADDDTFNQVITNIGIANKGLTDLQAEIAKIGKTIGIYAGIVAGITRVLAMVPGI